jgi:YVTN family beta-propeller protein
MNKLRTTSFLALFILLIVAINLDAQTTCGDQALLPESKDPSGFYLMFPLSSRTLDTVTINSIFDHSMTTNYCANNQVVDYLGHVANIQHSGFKVNFNCRETNTRNDLFGFETPAGTTLFYDGHPGYDYNTTDINSSGEVVVKAAASGTISCVATPSIKNQNNTKTTCPEGTGVGVIEMDHSNGYKTAYLHMKCSNFKEGDFVTQGTPIGISDGTGTCDPPSFTTCHPHLHFEMRKTVPSQTSPIPIDPYGWHGPSTTLVDTGGAGVGDPYIYQDPKNPRSTGIDFERLAADFWHSNGVKWMFDIEGDSRGWYPKNVENFSIQNARLNIDPQASDPQLIGPPLLNVRAADFPSVEIALASGAPDGIAQLFFTTDSDKTFTELKSVKCNITNDGQLHVYRFPMSQNQSWSGLIRQLRFDPSSGGITGSNADTISIKYIALSASPADNSCNAPASDADFSLFAAPSVSQTINPGGAASFRITTTSADGVARQLIISLTGVPPSSIASFSTPLTTTKGIADLEIKTSTATPAQNFLLTITAKQPDSGITKTVPVTVSVTNVSIACSSFKNLTQPIWATAGSGKILVAGRGLAYVIDPTTSAVSLVPFSPFPTSFSGKPIIVGNTGYVPLFNNLPDQIAVINLTTLAVRYFPSSPTPFALAVADGNLLVGHMVIHNDGSPASLDVVDPNTGGVLKMIPTGINSVGVAVATEARRAFVANHDSADISVIDLNTLTKITTIPLSINPASIVYLRGKIYVVGVIPQFQNDPGRLIAIDPATLAVAAPITVGRFPSDIALFNDSLVVPNQSDYNIKFVNINAGQPGITLSTDPVPTGVAVDPVSNKIYVSNQGNSLGSISVFCPSQGAPLAAALTVDPVTTQAGGIAVATLDLTDASAPGQSATISSPTNAVSTANSVISTGSSTASFVVRTNPISAGSSATVVGTINGTNQQTSLTVSSASLPAASLSASSISFPSTLVGNASVPQLVTLRNSGSANLVVDAIGIQGEFQQTNTCGQQLAPNAQCTIAVAFQPSTDGNRTGLLSISDGATDTPQFVSLSGLALPIGADFQIQPTAGLTMTVQQGSTGRTTLNLNALSGFIGTVSLSCSGVPATVTCALTPSQASLGPNATQVPITLSITTPPKTASNGRHTPPFWIFACIAIVLVVRGPRKQRAHMLLLSILLVIVSGCGGGGSSTPNAGGTNLAGTYSLTVTATSSTGSHQQQLTLIIQ